MIIQGVNSTLDSFLPSNKSIHPSIHQSIHSPLRHGFFLLISNKYLMLGSVESSVTLKLMLMSTSVDSRPVQGSFTLKPGKRSHHHHHHHQRGWKYPWRNIANKSPWQPAQITFMGSNKKSRLGAFHANRVINRNSLTFSLSRDQTDQSLLTMPFVLMLNILNVFLDFKFKFQPIAVFIKPRTNGN